MFSQCSYVSLNCDVHNYAHQRPQLANQSLKNLTVYCVTVQLNWLAKAGRVTFFQVSMPGLQWALAAATCGREVHASVCVCVVLKPTPSFPRRNEMCLYNPLMREGEEGAAEERRKSHTQNCWALSAEQGDYLNVCLLRSRLIPK